MLSGEHVLTASHDGTVNTWDSVHLDLCEPNYSLTDRLFIKVNFSS